MLAKLCVLPALLLVGAGAYGAETADYARAERMLTWNTSRLIDNEITELHWIGDGASFWYRSSEVGGHTFKRVYIARNAVVPLFDHAKMAAALEHATGVIYEPGDLPFSTLELEPGEKAIKAQIDADRYRCTLDSYSCREIAPARPDMHILSPDGKWAAYVENHNVVVQSTHSGKVRRLTSDGTRLFSYGHWDPFEGLGLDQSTGGSRWTASWSPDSRTIVVSRYDWRKVDLSHLMLSTRVRPRLISYPDDLPGDEHVREPHVYLLDVESEKVTEVNLPANTVFVTYSSPNFQWRERGDRVYFDVATRGFKERRLLEVDRGTGTTRTLIIERSDTYVDYLHWYLGDNSIFWISERDDWAHIYRYGYDGRLMGKLTTGEWPVGEIVDVEEEAGYLLFTARGREKENQPYFEAFYRLDLDRKRVELLTPEAATHRVSLSPDGRYFVDTYSRVDLPPVSVLRDADGRLIRTLERADISALRAIGWRQPEPFTVRARDGKTPLYGVLYKPSDFDPGKEYPLIDHIYPGPTWTAAPQEFFPGRASGDSVRHARAGQVQALAELGFIVMHFDAMGTALRSKSFHDAWYGDFADSGLPDHVAAIEQLAERYSYIDKERVGIYGMSGGGFASAKALLTYPDVYKVAVSMAGNHDNRSIKIWFSEKYNDLLKRDPAKGAGWDSYLSQANYLLAENLQGKLLLMHGTMDDNVNPAVTLRLVDALVKANKDFDMYILPEFPHFLSQNAFVLRKTWDYFVRNLLNQEPPREYRIETPARFPLPW